MDKDQLDRFKAWFETYVNGFYDDDDYINAHIKLKQDHARCVCCETVNLARALDLTGSETLIAETVALFHDVGRFEQFAKYQTYVDHKSVNHCLLALDVLRENKILSDLKPRQIETIETAITAAETGHLVMSTLHTLDATETINRIISVFPPYQQKQIRLQLASILKAVISQRLVPRADGKGRVPALEVMVTTARIRECIGDKDRTKELHDAISKGFTTYGMQTFDQSLMQLVKNGLVTYEEALKHVSNPDDFALRFRGIASTSDGTWDDFECKEEEEKKSAEGSDEDTGAAEADFIERF